MFRQNTGEDEAVLPLFGDRVKTRGKDAEISWPIVAGARVGLGRASPLKIHSGPAIRSSRTQHVLALHKNSWTASETQFDVRPPFLVDATAVLNSRHSLKQTLQVMLGDPATNSHLQSSSALNQVKDGFSGEPEFSREGMGRGYRGSEYGVPEELLGEELTVSRVKAQCKPLEPNEIQDPLLLHADEHLDRFADTLRALALPGVPTIALNSFDLGSLELETDEHLGAVVQYRIGADHDASLRVDANKNRCQQLRRITLDRQHGCLVAPVLDLESVLILGAIDGELRIREEGVSKDALTFP